MVFGMAGCGEPRCSPFPTLIFLTHRPYNNPVFLSGFTAERSGAIILGGTDGAN